MDSEWDGVKADLHRIRSLLLQRRGALVNMTADEGTLAGAQQHVEGFLSALPAEAATPASWSQMLPAMNEAIVVPTQVCQGDVLRGCTNQVCIDHVLCTTGQAGSHTHSTGDIAALHPLSKHGRV